MVSVKVKRGKKPLITIIIAVLIFCILSFAATKVIYDSTFPRYDCGGALPEGSEISSLKQQKKTYYSGENLLSGYLCESYAAEKRDALIVIVPGHNACTDSFLAQINELNLLGWSVFCFDASGVCSSEGESAVGFPQELLDLKATLNYIENENRFGYNDIVLLGHSRGGYAACCALSYDFDIAACVSVSGVNSAMEGVVGAAEQYVGPLAYLNYGFLWLYQSMLFGPETVNLRADKIISNTDTPVLIIHGENDISVPPDKHSIFSHKSEISGENTEFLTLPSGHTEILFDADGTANDSLINEINNFLVKHTAK